MLPSAGVFDFYTDKLNVTHLKRAETLLASFLTLGDDS